MASPIANSAPAPLFAPPSQHEATFQIQAPAPMTAPRVITSNGRRRNRRACAESFSGCLSSTWTAVLHRGIYVPRVPLCPGVAYWASHCRHLTMAITVTMIGSRGTNSASAVSTSTATSAQNKTVATAQPTTAPVVTG